MPKTKNLSAGLLAWALICIASPSLATPPKVVVSLKPIHSLVSGVMVGLGRPGLLQGRAQSPHGHALKPSQAAALQSAGLVFWIGPGMERNLAGRLAALAPDATAISLAQAEGVRLRPLSAGAKEDRDLHIWLAPNNARAILRHVARVLGEVDAPNAARYRANAKKVMGRLAGLEKAMEKALGRFRGKSFLADHQAYGYLADRFGLLAAGAITRRPGETPGAQHLVALGALIKRRNIQCILGEWRAPPARVRALIGAKPIRAVRIDPIGIDLKAGPDAYFRMMEGVARSLADCLQAPNRRE